MPGICSKTIFLKTTLTQRLRIQFSTVSRKYIGILLFLFTFLQSKAQTADFTYSSTGGLLCSPANIQFTQTATGTPTGFIWDLGNGTISNAANPATTYTNAGNYTVKLTVVYDNAAVTISKTIIVNPAASVSVTPGRNYLCKPGPVTFTASGNAPFVWSFGDGNTQTTDSAINTHTYTAFGNYIISVTAANIQGCTATAFTQVRVLAPFITATVSPQSGCIPATAVYNASVLVPAGGSVTNYTWNFGDSAIANTTGGNTSHTYTTVGSYNPSLSIITDEGCTNTYNFPLLAFGTPPANPVAYLTKDTICGSEKLVLNCTATNATNYAWDFGDGTSANISYNTTLHKYTTLGNKAISVTPSFNGCAGAIQLLNAFITGVIANFTSANSCAGRQTFTFTNTSLGNISSSSWRFGDGASSNNNNTVSHTYLAPGQFLASLTVVDSVANCVDSFKQTVYYAVPALVGTDTLVCKGAPISLNITGNYVNPSANYTWWVAGDLLGPISNSAISSYNTRNLGVFRNSVIIDNGSGYCPDTVIQANSLRVRGIQLNFNSTDNVCLNSTLAVTNTSNPFYPADSVRLYYWNFGDRPVNDTFYQPPSHQYSATGNYVAALFGTDKNGCSDSLKKTITVNPIPFVRSIPSVDTLCAGQVKTLISFHSDSVRWTPAAQVSCPLCDTVNVSPSITTAFVATSFNTFGCSSADTSVVKVFSPFTATTSFTDTSICLNDKVKLMAMPPGKQVLWLPAAGLSSATAYNPVASPAQTTQYQVALTDSAGCFSDTATLNIVIYPVVSVDAGPSQTYPYNALFNFQPTYSSNVVSYRWTPGTQLNCTDCAIPTGRNLFSQIYTVMATSADGCVAKDTVRILVECKDAYLLMPTAFSPDNNGLNDYYYPLTRGVGIIKNFAVYNRAGQRMYQVSNFSPNDIRFGWDGRYKGEPQPAGAYVFMLEAVCDAGQTLTRNGSFMLLK